MDMEYVIDLDEFKEFICTPEKKPSLYSVNGETVCAHLFMEFPWQTKPVSQYHNVFLTGLVDLIDKKPVGDDLVFEFDGIKYPVIDIERTDNLLYGYVTRLEVVMKIQTGSGVLEPRYNINLEEAYSWEVRDIYGKTVDAFSTYEYASRYLNDEMERYS